MKILLPVFCAVLAGCQSANPLPTPAPAVPMTAPAPVTPPPTGPTTVDPRLKRQAQMIEALLSQNDALTAKLQEPKPATVAEAPKAPGPVSTVPAPKVDNAIAPNSEGIIDLAALRPDQNAGDINPFLVRTAAKDARELAVHVSGIISGAVPCALVNDRLLQVGEAVESLTVEAIEAEAVLFRYGEYRFRVPVAEKNVRIRL